VQKIKINTLYIESEKSLWKARDLAQDYIFFTCTKTKRE
jgi:hypothetical protein